MSYISPFHATQPEGGAPLSCPDEVAFRRRTVLLVDDDEQVLDLLGEVITSMGHKVITAQDGREALSRLLKYRSIDCLFTDMVMPNGMSGLQLMAAARAIRPGLPALLASAYSREDICAQGDIPEDVDFIAKPYLLSDLTTLLDRLPVRRRGEPHVPVPLQFAPARCPGYAGVAPVILTRAEDFAGESWTLEFNQ